MTNDLSIELLPDEGGLTIRYGRDGVWLCFEATTGKKAMFDIELLYSPSLHGRGDIIRAALQDWCEDRYKQADQIRADNSRGGMGA